MKVTVSPEGGRRLAIVGSPVAAGGTPPAVWLVSPASTIVPRRSGLAAAAYAEGEQKHHYPESNIAAAASQQHQQEAGIHWKEVCMPVSESMFSGSPDSLDISSPRSTSSWQPLSDLGKNDDLFNPSLLSTEQSDLGTLRSTLAQVLPKENLARTPGLEHVTEEESLPRHSNCSPTGTGQSGSQHPLIVTHGVNLHDDSGLESMELGRYGRHAIIHLPA
jgi:hypothetical protein